MLTDDSHDLIASTRVNGTKVYAANGEHAGDIDHLLIDKPSGKIAYAVMTFGGFLGMGEDEHLIPWSALDYDKDAGGYRTGITKEQLTNAPRPDVNWAKDRNWEEEVFAHYGAAHYWM